jgi:hypothetical protein
MSSPVMIIFCFSTGGYGSGSSSVSFPLMIGDFPFGLSSVGSTSSGLIGDKFFGVSTVFASFYCNGDVISTNLAGEARL